MKNMLKKIKKTFFWKIIIENFFYPIIHFFWSYILNFEAKILYFFWSLKKKKYYDLKKNDKKLVYEDPFFQNLARKILDESTTLVEQSKKEILSKEYQEILSSQNIARAEKPYQKSLYNKLSQKMKNEIIDLASSDVMITTAARHMKIFPILTRVDVGHIIPRENTNPRAAMLWHKDNFGFKSLDFFMIITNVDENNGPLICLEKKVKAGTLKSFVSKKFRTGERGKVDLDEFNEVFGKHNTIELKGLSGNGLFIDSFSSYHRGGYCKTNERIMLRFCYQSVDAICDQSFYSKKDYFEFNKEIKKDKKMDIFQRYLYFKKPSQLTRFFAKSLVKFYSLIEYKYN